MRLKKGEGVVVKKSNLKKVCDVISKLVKENNLTNDFGLDEQDHADLVMLTDYWINEKIRDS